MRSIPHGPNQSALGRSLCLPLCRIPTTNEQPARQSARQSGGQSASHGDPAAFAERRAPALRRSIICTCYRRRASVPERQRRAMFIARNAPTILQAPAERHTWMHARASVFLAQFLCRSCGAWRLVNGLISIVMSRPWCSENGCVAASLCHRTPKNASPPANPNSNLGFGSWTFSGV